MRSLLLGLLSFLFAGALTGTSLAQSVGEVESIGLGGNFRPDCWVPMVVRINPATLPTKTYELRVYQTDADGDLVIFKKKITITGGEAGGQVQRFWMYFLPQPKLPDVKGSYNLSDLRKALKVTLNSDEGKELATLPVTSMLTSADPAVSGERNQKLILCVTDGKSVPVISDFDNPGAVLGVMEDYGFVYLKVSDLPENPLAYEAADYVVWLNADPAELKRGGDEKINALESWIKSGGHLVICTPADWQKMTEFGDLLPVKIEEVQNAPTLSPLKNIARQNRDAPINPNDPWEKVRGPYRVARAAALPGSVVEEWITWDADGKDKTPWLARKSYGAGAITWLAQDIGDPLITSYVKTGWSFVWSELLGLHDSPLIKTNKTDIDSPEVKKYLRGSVVNIGASLNEVNNTATSSLLVTIAILFFIVYWFLAGPGSFLYLANKKKSQYSWLAFSLCAVGATALTAAIVKIVLRGPPQAKQVTYVRAAQGEPAIIQSRIGLYIPRDGAQTIAMDKAIPNQMSYICPLSNFAKETVESKAAVEYSLAVRELTSEGSPSVTVPYRSTQKKFKTQWVGELPNRIEGKAALVDQKYYLEGKLTNGTGQDLRHVYFVFNYPGQALVGGDQVVFIPEWKKAVTMDLHRVMRDDKDGSVPFVDSTKNLVPESDKQVRGSLQRDWAEYWYPAVRSKGGMLDAAYTDSGEKIERSFPLMSLFGRLAPMMNANNANDRVEMIRRGARGLDVSAAVAGGSLVILAQGNGPLPYPATVEGDQINVDGPIYYQFILPLDRTVAEKEMKEQAEGK